MTPLDRQIRRSQHRLWLNRGIGNLSCVVGIVAAVFAVIVLVQRLFDLAIPLWWIGVGLSVSALLTAVVWTVLTREDAASAAAKLDEAAGLKERISSGHYCQGLDDPFAAAVVADAEDVGGSLCVRQHLRLRVPGSLALSTGSIVIAALMFLITPGLLKQAELDASEQDPVKLQQAKVAVKRKMEAIRRMAESSPAMEDFKDDLAGLDKHAGGTLDNPENIRHEAIKKIETLADAVKQKRRSDQYDSVKETRKAFRRLKVPRSSDAPTNKLTKALARGDFKSAKEEIKALQEQLATLKTKQDQEMAARISKQLDDLSKQLEKLAANDNLAKKLEQAGIKKKDIERMLENLSKKDLDQLRNQLEKKGFTQKQIDKLAKQLQQQQRAGSVAKKLSKSLKQGALCKNSGQVGEAIAGLSQAAQQLSDLEVLEQEMSQLDSTLQALQDAKNDLDKPCPNCGGAGKGCARCQGSGTKGPGMGRRMGQGRGGLAPEQQT
ncbi:MAG: hypothetical protein IIB60_04340, partial [Planctomycetes bacterium]|nr:hypothetical protein [Planctomycetota bacterium]